MRARLGATAGLIASVAKCEFLAETFCSMTRLFRTRLASDSQSAALSSLAVNTKPHVRSSIRLAPQIDFAVSWRGSIVAIVSDSRQDSA